MSPTVSGRTQTFSPHSKTMMSLQYSPVGVLPSTRSPEFPPNTKIFQKGTAKTATAVKFHRGGPQ